jgi:hypothetical protein
MTSTCTYCKKPITKKSWIGMLGTQQCSRFLCRIKSGHWLYWTFGLKIIKKPINIPWLRKI